MVQPAKANTLCKGNQTEWSLERLEKQNFVAPVDCPTDWVSNLVITEKENGFLQLCLDPKPWTQLSNVRDTPYRCQQMYKAGSMDTRYCVRHARYILACKALRGMLVQVHFQHIMGKEMLSSASKDRQKWNEQTFRDIEGVHVIANDVIIGARHDEEHDATVLKVIGVQCTWVKIESTKSHEPAILANWSSEPTKFLSCQSRSALLTKERLAIWWSC